MYKTIRSFALAVLLTLAAVPATKADRWGTNPRPQAAAADDFSAMDVMVDAVFFNLGIF